MSLTRQLARRIRFRLRQLALAQFLLFDFHFHLIHSDHQIQFLLLVHRCHPGESVFLLLLVLLPLIHSLRLIGVLRLDSHLRTRVQRVEEVIHVLFFLLWSWSFHCDRNERSGGRRSDSRSQRRVEGLLLDGLRGGKEGMRMRRFVKGFRKGSMRLVHCFLIHRVIPLMS